MRHTILANNSSLREDSFGHFARELGVDVPGFQTCLKDPKRFESDLQKDRDDASSVGVGGTPSFVIGPTGPGSMEGLRVVGAVSFEMLDAALKPLLGKPSPR